MWRFLLLTPTSVVLIADTATGNTDWVTILSQYGVALPFALVLLYGYRERSREVTAERATNKDLVERALPAITQSTDVLREVLELLRDEREARRRP